MNLHAPYRSHLSLRYLLDFVIHVINLSTVSPTNRYYGTYLSYGSGDTIIQTLHANSGPAGAGRKWHVECLDGEAAVGIHCHIRNYTQQFFCFSPVNVLATINTFITGSLWDNDLQFFVSRRGLDDTNIYKCCRAPTGYYIDYTSCYYMPTHDQYWEYYDSVQHIITYCASGYVMAGIAKKSNQYDLEWHVEWIQCCRVGFAGGSLFAPPSMDPKDPLRTVRSDNSTFFLTGILPPTESTRRKTV
ncbi:hypothetical protein RvY_04225-2 [Ramazzottius varieornatus]|uniref:Uncharacterized protein n=1 Tax=Ramazzottius varieornatus TaxID=947166 RepID=A0A1D1UQX0_RAMVA|nr:hypothetical protein RvY_04225-2 [Ramazzottius varieornatus]